MAIFRRKNLIRQLSLKKWCNNMLEIRRAEDKDIKIIGDFYDEQVLYMDENGVNYPRWMYKNYPTEQSVREAVANEEQYYCLLDGKLCAAFIINDYPGCAYDKGDWKKNLSVGEYLIIHTLSVNYRFAGKGIATEIVNFCLDLANKKGYKAVRVDVVPDNFPAARLYVKCGFTFAGEKDLERGLEHIPTFCLYEYNF